VLGKFAQKLALVAKMALEDRVIVGSELGSVKRSLVRAILAKMVPIRVV